MVYRGGFKDMFVKGKYKILRGDKVMITGGKDHGQVGTVLKVIRNTKFPRVIVEGLNLSKRHIKRTKDNPGGIISVESPLHYSNVQLVDPVNGYAVRAAWRWLADGTKVRITRGRKASGAQVPRPDILKERRRPLPLAVGAQDTAPAVVTTRTHTPGDLPSFLQHLRQYHSAAGRGSSSSTLGGSSILGGRQQQRQQQSFGRHAFWRGFAASALT